MKVQYKLSALWYFIVFFDVQLSIASVCSRYDDDTLVLISIYCCSSPSHRSLLSVNTVDLLLVSINRLPTHCSSVPCVTSPKDINLHWESKRFLASPIDSSTFSHSTAGVRIIPSVSERYTIAIVAVVFLL
jgi:hypothetical protein